LGLTAMCSLGWGNLVAFDWNDLPVGREFDCKFLKKVKSPPYALPPPAGITLIGALLPTHLRNAHFFSPVQGIVGPGKRPHRPTRLFTNNSACHVTKQWKCIASVSIHIISLHNMDAGLKRKHFDTSDPEDATNRKVVSVLISCLS